MANQHSSYQKPGYLKRPQDETLKGHLQPSTHRKGRRPGFGMLLLIFLVLGGIVIKLESDGTTNFVPAIGQGGRPSMTLGLWHFNDVSNDYWAKPFIEGLIQKRVISGYSDNAFRPEQTITRVEFAAMLGAAFSEQPTQSTLEFRDVPPEFWGAPAIQNAAQAGFFKGYPQGEFRPNQPISKADALVALVEGLGLMAISPIEQSTEQILSKYEDADQIPDYAREATAAAIAAGLVVNEASTMQLNPTQPMTRAEAAASVYQALVHLNQAEAISSL